jgi:hypothetical protein
MKVRLTHGQANVVKLYASSHPEFEPWLEETPHTPKFVTMTMPAIAWFRLFQWLEQDTLTVAGRNSSKVPKIRVNTRNNIRRTLNTLEAHPAMFNQALMGSHSELIPAWLNGRRATWSPYPKREGDLAVVMVPELVNHPAGIITKWAPKPERGATSPGTVFDPRAHWPFIQL